MMYVACIFYIFIKSSCMTNRHTWYTSVHVQWLIYMLCTFNTLLVTYEITTLFSCYLLLYVHFINLIKLAVSPLHVKLLSVSNIVRIHGLIHQPHFNMFACTYMYGWFILNLIVCVCMWVYMFVCACVCEHGSGCSVHFLGFMLGNIRLLAFQQYN